MLLQVAGPSQAREVSDVLDDHGDLRPGELRVTDDERAILLIGRTE
jgi:hypothetical protein